MKTLVAILAVVAVAGGFTGIAVACGPDEDRQGLSATAEREDAGALEAAMVPRIEAIQEGSGDFRYPPTLSATAVREGVEAAFTVWLALI